MRGFERPFASHSNLQRYKVDTSGRRRAGKVDADAHSGTCSEQHLVLVGPGQIRDGQFVARWKTAWYASGRSCMARTLGAWRSLVAHTLGVRVVAGSNPAAPTRFEVAAASRL